MDAPGTLDRRDGEVPRWVLDALLGTAVALSIALIIAAGYGGERAPDLVAYLFAVGFGALMLARHVAPRTVLIVSVLGMFGYYIMDYPPIGVAIPVVAALYAAADAGLTRWSVGAGATVLVVSVYFRLGEVELSFLLGYETVSNVALIVTAIALGYSTRLRRALLAQREENIRLTTQRAQRDAELRMRGQRERISRDLHDTVGHAMSVISLQSGVAAEAIGVDDDAARQATRRIRTASARSLRDMRSMVRLLRAGDEEGGEVLSLDDVASLWPTARDAGLELVDEVRVDTAALTPQVDATAYRVIQEALTNVVRHANASRVRVSAVLEEDELRVDVIDDGKGAATPGTGYGLRGMTERVESLGGTVSAEPARPNGFAVRVRIPVTA